MKMDELDKEKYRKNLEKEKLDKLKELKDREEVIKYAEKFYKEIVDRGN